MKPRNFPCRKLRRQIRAMTRGTPLTSGQRELLLMSKDMRYRPGPTAWATIASSAHL